MIARLITEAPVPLCWVYTDCQFTECRTKKLQMEKDMSFSLVLFYFWGTKKKSVFA